MEAVPSERVALAGKNNARARDETGVKAITADEHLMSRLRATYGDLYKDAEEKEDVDVKGEIASS